MSGGGDSGEDTLNEREAAAKPAATDEQDPEVGETEPTGEAPAAESGSGTEEQPVAAAAEGEPPSDPPAEEPASAGGASVAPATAQADPVADADPAPEAAKAPEVEPVAKDEPVVDGVDSEAEAEAVAGGPKAESRAEAEGSDGGEPVEAAAGEAAGDEDQDGEPEAGPHWDDEDEEEDEAEDEGDEDEEEERPEGFDKRPDVFNWILTPVMTLAVGPGLAASGLLFVAEETSGYPRVCAPVRLANGCEETLLRMAAEHTIAFLFFWLLLWALPWWRGLRAYRMGLAVVTALILIAVPLRLFATIRVGDTY